MVFYLLYHEIVISDIKPAFCLLLSSLYYNTAESRSFALDLMCLRYNNLVDIALRIVYRFDYSCCVATSRVKLPST